MQWVISPFYPLTPQEDNIRFHIELHTLKCMMYHFRKHRPTSQPMVATPVTMLTITVSSTSIVNTFRSRGKTNHNTTVTRMAVKIPRPRIVPSFRNHIFSRFIAITSFSLWHCEESSVLDYENILLLTKVGKRVDLCGMSMYEDVRQWTNYITLYFILYTLYLHHEYFTESSVACDWIIWTAAGNWAKDSPAVGVLPSSCAASGSRPV